MKKKSTSSEFKELRHRAEAFLKNKRRTKKEQFSEAEILKLIHELEVHQIELEMQNDELRMAQSSLNDAVDNYTELYDFAPSGYFTLSREGEILRLNLKGAGMLGKERSKILNTNFKFYLHKESLAGFNNFLELIFETSVIARFEAVLKADQNTPFTHVLLTAIVTEKNNECWVSATDISAIKKTENLLKIKDQQLFSVLENSNASIWAVDKNLCLIFGNALFHEHINIGLNHTFQIGESLILPVLNDKEKEQWISYYQRALNGESFSLKKERQFDNKEKWNEYHLGPTLNEKGEITGATVVAHDITKQLSAEKALNKSQEMHRVILENIQDPVFITDDKGDFTFICPNIENSLGFAVDEIKRMGNISNLLSEKLFNKTDLNKVNIISNIDTRIIDKNGVTHDFLITVKKVSIDTGTILYALHDVTELKLAEKEIVETHTLLKKSQELGNIGTWKLNIQENILDWSSGMYKIFEMPTDTPLTYELFMNCIHPDDRNFVNKEWSSKLMTNNYDIEHRLLVDGKVKWVREKAEIKYNAQGEPVEAIGFTQDISEQKQTVQALRNSEIKFRALFEQSGGYCMVLDPNTDDGIPIILDANLAACEAHGYLREEFIGRPVAIIDDEDGKKLVRERTQQILSGEPFYVENTHLRKDGTTFTVAVNAKRIDIENEPSLIFTTEYDISEQKKTENRLRENEKYLKKAQRVAKLGNWKWHVQENTLEWSDEMYIIFGIDKKNFSGVLLNVITQSIHPDDRKAVEASFKSALEQKKPISIEYRIIQPNGSELTVWAEVGDLIKDKQGQPKILIGILQDITQLKLAESELKTANKKLEELYIHQNEIRENERKAISREIHDELGQSLTALKIDLSWVADHLEDKKLIKKKVQGMLNITDSTIKIIQRISSELRPGLLDDLGLIPAMEWYCHEFEARTDIPCSFKAKFLECTNETIIITLYRILQEALTNVIRHANASKVKVELIEKEQSIYLKIYDNGIGISAAQINSSKSLGLKGINERLKPLSGRMKIISPKGVGTQIVIFIPSCN